MSWEHHRSVADPGFPIGGHGPIRGGMDLQCGCFLAKMCAKMKEFGPIGAHVPSMSPLDPPMQMYSNCNRNMTILKFFV